MRDGGERERVRVNKIQMDEWTDGWMDGWMDEKRWMDREVERETGRYIRDGNR